MLNLGPQIDKDISLSVRAVQESVTVIGEAMPFGTSKAEVAGVVTARQIKTLPVNTRQYLNLSLLKPGTTQDASGTFYNNNADAGGRYYANGFPVDRIVNRWAENGRAAAEFPGGCVQGFKISTI